MKKLLAIILALSMIFALSACGGKSEQAAPAPSGGSQSSAPASSGSSGSSGSSASTPAPAAESVTLKMGHQMAVDHSVDIVLHKWSDAVKAATDGRIIIDIYAANQLGSIQEMQEACRLGTLDICLGDPSMMSSLQPEYGMMALPFIFENYDAAEKIYDGAVGQAMAERLEKQNNMVPLGFFWNGMRCFVTKKPLTSLADCKGYKLRSPEAQIYIDTFTLLGMSPTPIAWADVFTSIQTGVVEGTDTTPESVLAQEFYTVAPYVCESNHMLSTIGPCVNSKVWAKLSADDQKIVKDCFTKELTEQRKAAISKDADFYAQLKEKGATITHFSDIDAIKAVFIPYWTEYATKNNCTDILDMITN